MNDISNVSKKFEQLRRQAEEFMMHQKQKPFEPKSDPLGLIHELQTRHIELESRNEELRRARETLSKVKKEYEDLYEFAPVGYLTLKADGTIERANRAAVKLLKTQQHSLVHSGFSRFVAPGWGEAYRTVRRRVVETGEKQGIELPVLQENEPLVWIRADIEAVSGGAGIPSCWRMVLVDITERKRMEEELKRQAAQYRLLVDNPADLVIKLDVFGKILFVNSSFCRLFGRAEDDFSGESFLTLIRQEDSKEVFRVVEKTSHQPPYTAYVECRARLKEGWRWFGWTFSAFFDTDGKTSVVGIGRDIHGQKLAETALREQTDKLNNILEKAADGICLCHNIQEWPYVKFTLWNPRMTEITGYTIEEINSSGWYQTLYTDSQVREKAIRRMERMREGDDIIAEVWRITDKQGERKPVSISTSVVKEMDGEVHVLAIIQEITEHKRLEEERLQAKKIQAEHEKYALVGKVAGKMAHDFNNILAGIMGSAQIALLREVDDKIRKTLELIVEQSMRGKNLTRNLVAFARDQEPSREFFPVQEKIDLVLTILKRDLDGIEVVTEYTSDLPDLLADPGMIEHGLVNLIHNSIHALGKTEHPKISIRTYEKDGTICIEIEDNGCGIPKGHMDRIYEPAFTLKGSRDVNGWYDSGIKGTGYGMANVKKYVELHRGEIAIDSKAGAGTKVTLSFPLAEKGLSDREISQIEENDFHIEKTILLVEDERTISDIQYNLLTSTPCRHRVDVAETGQDAVELFDVNKYDCVSLDYVLPGGMNGMDVYQHIRKIDETVPVLFVSGNLEFLESVKSLKREDPYLGYISKPCRNAEYLKSINRLLGRSN